MTTRTARGKFTCQSRTTHSWSKDARTFVFSAVYDQGLAGEDESFARATPTGSLTIQVDNPAVEFEPGRAYYLDLTLADTDAE